MGRPVSASPAVSRTISCDICARGSSSADAAALSGRRALERARRRPRARGLELVVERLERAARRRACSSARASSQSASHGFRGRSGPCT